MIIFRDQALLHLSCNYFHIAKTGSKIDLQYLVLTLQCIKEQKVFLHLFLIPFEIGI